MVMTYNSVTQRSHCDARNDFLELIGMDTQPVESFRLGKLSVGPWRQVLRVASVDWFSSESAFHIIQILPLGVPSLETK